MTIIPLHDYVLIKPDKASDNIGGIIVSRQKETESGTVIAVGPEAEQLHKGDRVMYKDYNTLSVKRSILVRGKDKEEELTFIKYADVICIDDVRP